MGFFSRQDSTTPRGQTAQNEQLAELRRRARRRLVGALVIVLIAVVFVPLFLNSDGIEEVEQVVQVFPPIVAPQADPQLEPTPWDDEVAVAQEDLISIPDEQPGAWAESAQEQAMADQSAETQATVSAEQKRLEAERAAAQARAEAERQAAAAAKSTPAQPEQSPTQTAKPAVPANEPKRTDDGSVALALLEGRMAPDQVARSGAGQAAAQKGAFIVQVAAYSSQDTAQARRDQLAAAGVSNAFIQSGAGSSGTTYRLRVGPFESRQAAEAALTRLRSLGYDDSFIRAQ